MAGPFRDTRDWNKIFCWKIFRKWKYLPSKCKCHSLLQQHQIMSSSFCYCPLIFWKLNLFSDIMEHKVWKYNPARYIWYLNCKINIFTNGLCWDIFSNFALGPSLPVPATLFLAKSIQIIDLFTFDYNTEWQISHWPFDICLFRGGGVGWLIQFNVPPFGMTTFKASSKASRGLLGLSSSGVSRSTEPESTLKIRNYWE